MGCSWITTDAVELQALFDRLAAERADREVSFIEATALVPGRGAFVALATRADAAELLLAETVVLWSRRSVDGYEELLGEELIQACFVAGESKTADIEQQLVSGVHGPAECIFVAVQ